MKLYELTNKMSGKATIRVNMWVADLKGVNFNREFKEIEDVEICDYIGYSNANILNVLFFEPMKKGVLRIECTYTCKNLDEFNKIVNHFK